MSNHDDTGSLSAGQRLTRLEDESRARDRDDELSHGKLWKEFDDMKEKFGNLKQEIAVSNARLTVYVALVVFVAGLVAQWVMKRM